MDLQELVDEASAILEAPVTLEDRGLRLLAFAAHDAGADHVRVETVLGRGAGPRTREWFESFDIARARGPVHVPAHPEREIAARLCLPARARGVVRGYLWAVEPPEGLAPERVRAAQALAARAGEVLARATSRRRETERLLLDLLETGAEGRGGIARELADDLAIASTASVVCAVLGGAPGVRLQADQVHGPGGVPRDVGVAERSGDLVLLVPAEGPGSPVTDVVESAIAALARLGLPGVVAGVGGEVPLRDAVVSDRRARAALRVVRPRSRAQPSGPAATRVHAWDALGVTRLLGGRAADELVEAVRTPAVTALLDGPEELVETAWVYLEEAGSVAATASRLGLHRQSVYHRIHRIEALTGLDLSRGRDRLELHLALVVLRTT
ncbi:helix-turn-helix domain-containing protein [Janibacter cremeus]|uniref:PucR family transcriptional regulator n=1 Tax=Janibacter cremeus TaxID=1285192 RepID=UPI0023F761CE|nr:helix-turn-helix domain-containing protein [Janibacter cremeus]WEV78431.1 helix-turn-helix domain-containing protein [Janibacter cremeus]